MTEKIDSSLEEPKKISEINSSLGELWEKLKNEKIFFQDAKKYLVMEDAPIALNQMESLLKKIVKFGAEKFYNLPKVLTGEEKILFNDVDNKEKNAVSIVYEYLSDLKEDNSLIERVIYESSNFRSLQKNELIKKAKKLSEKIEKELSRFSFIFDLEIDGEKYQLDFSNEEKLIKMLKKIKEKCTKSEADFKNKFTSLFNNPKFPMEKKGSLIKLMGEIEVRSEKKEGVGDAVISTIHDDLIKTPDDIDLSEETKQSIEMGDEPIIENKKEDSFIFELEIEREKYQLDFSDETKLKESLDKIKEAFEDKAGFREAINLLFENEKFNSQDKELKGKQAEMITGLMGKTEELIEKEAKSKVEDKKEDLIIKSEIEENSNDSVQEETVELISRAKEKDEKEVVTISELLRAQTKAEEETENLKDKILKLELAIEQKGGNILSLEQRIGKQVGEIGNLGKEKERLESLISVLEKEKSNQDEEKAKNLTSINTLEASIRVLENQIKENNINLDELKNEKQNLEDEVEKLKKNENNLKKQIEKKEEEINDLGNEITELKQKFDVINNALSEKKIEIEALKIELETLTSQNKESAQKIEDLKTTTVRLEEEVNKLEGEKNQNDATIEELELQISSLSREKEENSKKIKELEDNIAKSDVEKREQFQEELVKIKEEQDRIVEQLDNITKEKNQLKIDNESLNEKIGEQHSSLEKIENEKKDLEVEINKFVEENKKLNQQIEEKNKEIDGFRVNIANLKEDSEILRTEIYEKDAKIEDLNLKIEQLIQKGEENNVEIARLTEEIKTNENVQTKQLEAQFTIIQNEQVKIINQLKENIEQKDSLISELESKSIKAEETIKKEFEKKIGELNKVIEGLKEENAQKEKKYNLLSGEIGSIGDKLAENLRVRSEVKDAMFTRDKELAEKNSQYQIKLSDNAQIIEALNIDIEKAQSELEEKKNLIINLKNESDKNEEKISILENKLDQLKIEMGSFNQLKQRFEELNSYNFDLKEQVEKTKIRFEKTEEKKREESDRNEKEIKALREVIRTINNENETARAKLTLEIKKLEGISKRREDGNIIKKQMEDLKNQYDAESNRKELEIKKLNNKIERIIKNQQNELKEIKDENGKQIIEYRHQAEVAQQLQDFSRKLYEQRADNFRILLARMQEDLGRKDIGLTEIIKEFIEKEKESIGAFIKLTKEYWSKEMEYVDKIKKLEVDVAEYKKNSSEAIAIEKNKEIEIEKNKVEIENVDSWEQLYEALRRIGRLQLRRNEKWEFTELKEKFLNEFRFKGKLHPIYKNNDLYVKELIEVMEKLKEKDSKEKLFKQNDRELFLNDENEQFDPKKFLELGYQYSSLLSSIKWLEKEIKFFSGYKLLGLNKDLTIAIDVVEKDREKQLKLVDQLINSISNLNYYSEEQKNEILMKLDNAKSELEKFSSIINSYSRYLEQNSNNLILN